MTDKRGFRPDIEGLRAIAVLLVVVSHATGWPRGGFLGVDVFFVLSGFLITGLLVGEAEKTGRVSLRGFYARRVRRLLPVAVLVLVVTDLVAVALLLPGRARDTVVDSLWALGSVANVRFAQLGTDYFSQTRPPSAVLHYWSLSVEEQFYFVWPTLVVVTLVVAARRGWTPRRAMTCVAVVVVVASFVWSVVSTVSSPVSAYFSAATRAWELGAGALLALLAPAVRSRPVLSVLGGLGLLASVLVIEPTTAVPGYAVALPVLATVALLAGSPAVLGQPVLRYVGRISYSLYLWHWPALVLAADVPGGATPVGTTIAVLVAVALSVASYHLVEAPVRASSWLSPRTAKRHSRRRPLLAPGLVAGAVVLLAAAWVLTVPDAPARQQRVAASDRSAPLQGGIATDPGAPPQTAALPEAPPLDLPMAIGAALALKDWPAELDSDVSDDASPEWTQDKCLDIGPRNLERCVYGTKAAARTVALVGDSVAISWLPALREALAQRGWRIQVLTRRQCPNARLPGGATRAVSESCTGHQAWVRDQLSRIRPDLMVLSNGYGGATPEQWLPAVRSAFSALAPLAARTVVLAPPPETGNLQKCHTRLSEPAQCIRSVADEWRAFSGAERTAAAASGATWIDTRPWFCLQDRCPAVVDATPVHFDGKHLAAVYARLLGPALRDVLI